ncbi:putative methoprene-tolerant protein [Anopheles sinensis]|uniref:Methoprene-tolerant protein n=1 Tax=Anopheles sinensis TaxID=74873 RepID=A0A084W0Q6_ANOSI|nr:putative methoprene-tolerant protein [Anopheles sinensis]WOY10777.1 juvenile hormone receptor protein [Anopheles sinensis]WPC83335.1 methoprene-tolerant protein [Anopheles sinensis]
MSTQGYAPGSDGMSRRSSYYGHRFYGGPSSGSSFDDAGPSTGHGMRLNNPSSADDNGFAERFEGFGPYAEENRPFFPPTLHPASGSYQPSLGYSPHQHPHHHHHHHPGAGRYGYTPSGALRMQQDVGMYGGNYSPSVPTWYQHPSAHQHHHPHPHGGYQQHLAPHQPHHQSATPRCYPLPPEHMYSMFNFNRNGREARNRAEKNRRDKLNGSIQELSAMVPHVAESPRRVDKTAVLRFSAHGLRVDYVFGKSKPEETFKPEAQDSLFRMLNGFLLTVTCRGQIVLVSPSVEQFLGHCQTDLYGQNLFNLTHPDDHALLKQQLVPTNLVNLFDGAASPGSGPVGTSSSTSGSSLAMLSPPLEGKPGDEQEPGSDQRHSQHDEEEEIDRRLRKDTRKFTIRMARAGPRSEATTYELVTIDGCFRRADLAPRGTAKSGGGGTSGMQMIRRARGRDEAIPLHSINGNDIVLIGLARVMKVPSICDRLIEACKYEYKTRHLIDGRIVQCDQRISIVAGYLTDEVSGLSPFTFMHRDDVRWVIVALRQMYDYNQNGESCYRLMSRTGDFIYLKTRGYLEVDSDTKVVQSFVCINTLVSEEEGQRLVREMKRKFSVIVDKVELPDESGEPVVENPMQIEEAVMNLITNLDGEEKLLSTMPASPASSVKSCGHGDGMPGLAIVAPEKSSIKSAIVKSINVVSIASKTIREARSSPGDWSPLNGDQQSSNDSSSTGAPPQRATVLQKRGESASPQPSGSGSSVEQRVPPLPNSEHYFTQPFSPSGGGGTSVLSPASSQHSQRNVRSPHGYGGSVPSPPSNAFSRAETTSGGQTRTTSVLKRTYSNSSICSLTSSDNYTEYNSLNGGNPGESKRCKTGSPDLASCFNELMNPASDLTSFLPNSFDVVDQSLTLMETTTTIIREQVSNFPNLHESHNQLERIAEEHQEQRQMLQSIQEEFQIQMSNGVGSRSAAGRQGPRSGSGGNDNRTGLVTVTTPSTTPSTTSYLLAGSVVDSDAIFCNTGPHGRQSGGSSSTVSSMMPSVITPNIGRTQAHGSTLDGGS